jgi:hypothetical protein
MVKILIRKVVAGKVQRMDSEMEPILVKLATLAQVNKDLRTRYAKEQASGKRTLDLHEFLAMQVDIPREQQRLRRSLAHLRAKRQALQKGLSFLAT